MININHSLDNIIFFSRHSEQEAMAKFNNKGEFFTIFTLYLFVVEGNEPSSHINKILFGKDDDLATCLWTITLKDFLNNIHLYIKNILNKKLEEFQNNQETRASLGYLHEFICHNNKEKNIDILINVVKDNIQIHITSVGRENDSSFMEYFEVRSYPSFSLCYTSKIHSINYKNNPFRLGIDIDTPQMFVDWFKVHMITMLEIYCETILVSWIVKNSHNY